MIICPSRKPRSTVRGPTRSLNENSCPGSTIVPSMYSAISCTLWIRFDDEVPISVVNVEICSRIPSRSASAVVRSARVCFRRREARRIDDVAAAEIESEIHRPSGARPGRDGRIRTAFPSTTKRALTARWRHSDRNGSTAFAIRSGVERDPEAGAVRAEADELRQALRGERADVLVLEGERDRLGDELLRGGERLLGRRSRSLGLDVANRRVHPAIATQDAPT